MRLHQVFEGIQLKHNDGVPPRVTPSTGGQSPHPYRGKMVGTSEDADTNSLKVGDQVHLGFGAKGGAGFRGTVIRVDHKSGQVWIKNDQGKTYRGSIDRITHEMTESAGIIRGIAAALGISAVLMMTSGDKIDARNTPLGHALKAAAEQGDEEAARYYRHLNSLVDASSSKVTLIANKYLPAEQKNTDY